MNQRAQSALEYLLTYGWALVLIATVIAVLVFLVSSPASKVVFTSSDSTKILVKAGAADGTSAEIQLQNITGGKIEITAITPTRYSACTIDASSPPMEIKAGSTMTMECTAPSDGKGSIQISYTDYAGLPRSVTINGSDGTTWETTGGASGPTGMPITNAIELQAINNSLDGDYYLANDIDCSGTSAWNGGAGFEPIGTGADAFTGVLDGQGHKIMALAINRPAATYIGLFGNITNEVKDLVLENFNINGGTYAGTLAGANNGVISNVRSTGFNVTTGSGGGLVGASYGSIANCYANGTVNSSNRGGMLAYSNYGEIRNSHSDGIITCSNRCGGLVGSNYDKIFDSYSNAWVTSTGSYAGGLAAYNEDAIYRSYSSGAVTGLSQTGGFVGQNDGSDCTDCFWDTDTSGKATSACNATGRTTAQMEQQATFNGWDFAAIWEIDEGSDYPRLRWE